MKVFLVIYAGFRLMKREVSRLDVAYALAPEYVREYHGAVEVVLVPQSTGNEYIIKTFLED